MQRDDTISGTNPQIAQIAADSKDKQTRAIISRGNGGSSTPWSGIPGSRLSVGARYRILGPRRSFCERSGSARVL